MEAVNTNSYYSAFNEVSDDENNDIIREIEKLTDDDLQIVKREIVFI